MMIVGHLNPWSPQYNGPHELFRILHTWRFTSASVDFPGWKPVQHEMSTEPVCTTIGK